MANPEHPDLLLESVESWNEWRRQNPDIHPDLEEVNLAWVDLSGADLHGANLCFTNLRHANLTSANLTGASLWCATLTGANLCKADLTRANLESAHLENAILIHARLDGAMLSQAFLKEIDLGHRKARLKIKDGRYAGIEFPRGSNPPATVEGGQPAQPAHDPVREPNPEHLAILNRGAEVWNAWRAQNRKVCPDLKYANISRPDLRSIDLREADLRFAYLKGVDLIDAQFDDADLSHSSMLEINIENTTFVGANLSELSATLVIFKDARFSGANLLRARFTSAQFFSVDLRKANLSDAQLGGAALWDSNLTGANLARTDLRAADLKGSTLNGASLRSARLADANLSTTNLVEVDFTGADLTGCSVYGISAWNLKLDGAKQSKLLINGPLEPPVSVDDLEMAQFIHLLMTRQKLRNVITTMGEKAVLILGRFTERKELLDRMADKLRALDFLPMIFDFERPTDRDLTETVKVLAGLSRFVIADITNPRSVPLELQATVPDYMIPFVIIVEKGQPVFGMFDDLPRKHDWALPLLEYSSAEKLIEAFDEAVVNPALEKSDELRRKKAALPLRRSI